MNTSLKKKTLKPIFHGHENRDFHGHENRDFHDIF